MALRYRHGRFPTPPPVVSLGGQMDRPRPVVAVNLIGPGGAWPIDALLDTGSDDTAFPERLARMIGLDLTNAPVRHLTDIGPVGYRVRYADVRLWLTDGVEFREWPATVAFTDAPLLFATLGFAGCLQYFTATFHGDLAEAELAVNPTYPGT